MAKLLESLRLDKNKYFLLRVNDPTPHFKLGEFVDEYITNLNYQKRDMQIQMLCGLIDTLFKLGVDKGKESAVSAIKSLIFKGKV